PSGDRRAALRRQMRQMTQLALVRATFVGLGAGPGRAAAAGNFDWAGHVQLDAEGLASDDPAKRLEAVSDLGKYDIALTQAYLLRALSDTDDKVRIAAARTLGRGGSTAAVPTMIEWLTDPDVKVKQVAADVL